MAFLQSSLERIVLPPELECIGLSAFNACRSLTSLKFAAFSVIREIGREAFIRSGLKAICIPSSVVKIEPKVFAGCHSLRSVTFEDNSQLTEIGPEAFTETFQLRIVLPKSVHVIGAAVFLRSDELVFELLQLRKEVDWRELGLGPIYRKVCYYDEVPGHG
jgi:hypothetical protein